MEIKVVLSADDRLLSAIQLLAGALSSTNVQPQVVNVAVEGVEGLDVQAVMKEAMATAKVEQDIPKTPEKEVETKQETPKKEVKSEPDSKEEKPATETKEHTITLEQLRAEAKKLGAAGKQAELKAIFSSFGAEKLSAVPEADYPAALAKIKEALGED